MKYEEKELVRFEFKIKTYYRDARITGCEEKEVVGVKTLKLFKSWFRLMKNRGKALYGVLTFLSTGEVWCWTVPSISKRSGWLKVVQVERIKEMKNSLCADTDFERILTERITSKSELTFGKEIFELKGSITRVEDDIRSKIQDAFESTRRKV